MGVGLGHAYATALTQRIVLSFFLGGVFGDSVSLYVGLFPPWQRGLLAGIVHLVYNGGDALLSWFGGHYDAHNWRIVLKMGGFAALAATLVMWLAVPDDRKLAPCAVLGLAQAGMFL